MSRITSPTGGTTTVAYSTPDCSGSAPRSANTERCYPVEWTTPGGTAKHDWMHKYVVTSVTQADPVTSAPDVVTEYSYPGTPAWAYTTDPITPTANRTWSEFRGYDEVVTKVGSVGSQVRQDEISRTKVKYFRGIHGDRMNSAGDPRTVSVSATDSTSVLDYPRWAGTAREVTTYANAGAGAGTIMSRVITTPWATSNPTAGSSSSLRAAYMTGVASTKTIQAADSASGNLRTRVLSKEYNDITGQVISVSDTGDTAREDDERCEAYSYADSTPADAAAGWRIGFVNRTVISAGLCSSTPLSPPNGLISDTRTYYDQMTNYTTVPTQGLVAKTERSLSTSGGTGWQPTSETTYKGAPSWLPETVKTFTSAGTRADKTDYTIANGLVVGTSQTTDYGSGRLNLVSTTVLDPGRRSTLSEVNANGAKTFATYDALGRALSVWMPRDDVAPGATPTGPATMKFTYTVANNTPSKIGTDSITSDGYADGGTYTHSAVFYDGLGREKQTQVDSPVSRTSRVITNKVYDGRGLVTIQLSDYEGSGVAGSGYVPQTAISSAPTEHAYVFDGLSRMTSDTLRSYNAGLWVTNYNYAGMDTTTVTPPDGASPTRSVTDILGRVTTSTNLGAPGSSDDLVTTTTYSPRGYRAGLQSPAGKWTYDYYPDGKVRSQVDPDAGTSSYLYENTNELRSTTDGNGRILEKTYDRLGRPRTLAGKPSSNGPSSVLTEWTYDNAATGMNGKGLPYETIRYLNGKNDATLTDGANTDAIVERVNGYTVDGLPTDARTRIFKKQSASVLTGFQSEFVEETGYTANRLVDLQKYPQVRNAAGTVVLNGDNLGFTYNHVGGINTVGNRGTDLRTGSSYFATGALASATLKTSTGAKLSIFNGYENGSNRLSGTIFSTLETQQGATNQPFANYAYTYDDAGNLTRSNETIAGDTQCFRFDAHQRLHDAWTPASAGSCGGDPALATLGGPAPYRQTWEFDDQGHRESQFTMTPTGSSTENYTYPALASNGMPGTNQPNTLAQIDRTTTVNSVETPSTDTFQYDSAGNTKRRGHTGPAEKVPSNPAQSSPGPGVVAAGPQYQKLTWDGEGNLSELTVHTRTGTVDAESDPISARVNYFYSAGGTELLRVTTDPSSGKVSTTLFMGHTDVTVTDSDGHGGTGQPSTTTAKRYLDVGAGVTVVRDDITDNFMMLAADIQGSATMAIGSDRAPTRRYQTPYGAGRTLHGGANGASANPQTLTAGTATGAAWPTKRGFLAMGHDTDTGLTSIGARNYDPAIGRFISIDPVLDPLSPAQALGYSYANNNPITFSDPSGLICQSGEKYGASENGSCGPHSPSPAGGSGSGSSGSGHGTGSGSTRTGARSNSTRGGPYNILGFTPTGPSSFIGPTTDEDSPGFFEDPLVRTALPNLAAGLLGDVPKDAFERGTKRLSKARHAGPQLDQTYKAGARGARTFARSFFAVGVVMTATDEFSDPTQSTKNAFRDTAIITAAGASGAYLGIGCGPAAPACSFVFATSFAYIASDILGADTSVIAEVPYNVIPLNPSAMPAAMPEV